MNKTREEGQGRWNRSFSAGVLLCCLTVLVFANSFRNDFVGYDDQNLIQNNPAIRSLAPDDIARMFMPKHRGNYQPVRTLSYAVDYALWGPRPFGIHLTNIILHVVTVIGVWLLVRHLLPEPVPLLAAAIFAVHPIHVESVTWMSARKDVLSLAFFLLAILWYERSYAKGRIGLYLLSIIAAALALLSKLTAVSLPFCILLLEICRDGWPNPAEWRRKLIRLIPHFLAVFLVVGLNFVRIGAVPSHGDALARLDQVGQPLVRDVWLSMPLVVCRYIGLLFVPARLSTEYDVARISQFSDLRVLLPVAFLTAIAVVGVFCFLRGKNAFAFCVGWFFITFLPTSNLVPTAAMMNDRYMHVPSIGFAVILAMALAYPAGRVFAGKKPEARLLVLFPVVIILLFFSALTVRRNADWRDTLTLFTRTLLVAPQSIDARLAIGAVYDRAGDYDSAIRVYREALEIAPDHYRVLYNLGVAYNKKGWVHQATQALEESRKANPDFLATHFNLALSYHRQKRYEEAIAEHKEVLRINSGYAAAHGGLGQIYRETGKIELALEQLNRALAIQPDLIPALVDRAGLLIQQGRHDEAKRDLQRLESLGVDVRKLRATFPD